MKKITLLLFLVASLLQAQQNEKIVAKIGDKLLTERELKERFELTPQIGVHKKNSSDELKEELLYTIIAEKLWALEAEKLGFDTTETMQYTYPVLEKMYLRDGLYSKEIKENVVLNPDAYIEGRRRSAYNILTKFFYSEKQAEIDSMATILKSGMPFDSLYNLLFFDSGNYYEVQYGKMEEKVEDTLYSLKPGEYTNPIKSPDGWYIFKVESLKQNFFTTEADINSRDSNIKKTVENRATAKVYKDYYSTFFKDTQVNTDGTLFWSLTNQIINILKQKYEAAGDSVKEGKLILADEDFNTIEKNLGPDTLNMVFVKFDKNPATLREFLYDFFFEGFYTQTVDPTIIRGQINSRVKYFIERELLARESYKEGIQNNPDVKFYNSVWRDNYLGTLYKRYMLNNIKVSDEEAFEKYNENNQSIVYPKQVNIIEILTDSLEVVERVFNKLDDGADFKELATKYNKRQSTKNSGGEFGMFPTTEHGDIGKIAGEMEIGEVYGPLETDEGYSIFKVIDKKDETKEIEKPFEDIKMELKAQIGAQKLRKYFKDQTAVLAEKYGVSVDENVLKSIRVNNLAMIVYRYMGFGGRIFAVPFSNYFTDWKEVWENNKKSLP